MRFRNAITKLFGNVKNYLSTAWKELGTYTSYFSSFGTDIYANEIVRACIRAKAEHSSKSNVRVLKDGDNERVPGNKALQRMIQQRPNIYMNGKDFIYKVRTMLEINNIVFIYIQRDAFGKCIGLYPMPKATYEAVDVGGELYIKFSFNGNGMVTTLSWEDLAVLRKDYNGSDVFTDSNDAILTSLDLLNTTNEGMANAIKSTANLRGILKSTKAMLSPEDAKAQKDRFVSDYMTMANGSGIASLDSTLDFKELNIQPQIANYKSIEELRNNIYRYFGVNEEIIMSKAKTDMWQAFYEGQIEGFLLALSLELTNKIFTISQKNAGYEIIFEANRLDYISIENKLAFVALVDRGAMTPNRWAAMFGLPPQPGGEFPVRRLDTAPTNQTADSVDDNNADDNNGGNEDDKQ